jgi:hypothetical protein
LPYKWFNEKNPKVKKNMSDKAFEAQKFGQERR